MEMKKSMIYLRLTFYKNPQKFGGGGVLRGAFQGFGWPKRHPDTLLAKTMFLTIYHAKSRRQLPIYQTLASGHITIDNNLL